jgi:serine phosphatase RsbU (regulator of sigma subunit)
MDMKEPKNNLKAQFEKRLAQVDVYALIKVTLLFLFFFLQNNIAHAQAKQGQAKIDSLLTVLKRTKEDTNKVNLLYNISDNYETIGEYDKGIQYGNQGVTLAQRIGYKKGEAKCYNIIGYIYQDQSDYPKAFIYYTKSLKILEQTDNKSVLSSCYSNIAVLYAVQKEYLKSVEFFFKSLKLAKEIGNNNLIARICSNIGAVYAEAGEYSKSFEYLIKSKEMCIKLGDRFGVANCYVNIGLNFEKQFKYNEAMEYLTYALKIMEELEVKDGIAGCLSNISELNIILKKYSLAKEQAQRVMKISKEIGEVNKMRTAYSYLASAEFGLGNYKEAYLNHVKFKELTDSIFNAENSKQLSDIKTNYEVDKKETELKASQEKKDVIAKAASKQQRLLRNSFICGFAFMFLLAGVSYRNFKRKQKDNVIITKQKQEVEHQKEVLEEKNHEILKSITYAQRLQDAILPPLRIVKEYLKESFILYKPKDIVAGDFYWMETIQFENLKMKEFENAESNSFNKNEIVLFAAADCTGHGVPGAMVSVVCSNALNRTVKEFGITTPGLILDKVRELVIETFVKSEREIKDGMDISLCAFNTATGHLQWAGANNPLWIIRNETKELEAIKPDKQPIGKTENPVPFTTHDINLNQGDCFYIFTDGYQDQFGGDKGKKFMAAKMKELFLSIYSKPMEEQKKLINVSIETWKGPLEQVDDICVIGVRV